MLWYSCRKPLDIEKEDRTASILARKWNIDFYISILFHIWTIDIVCRPFFFSGPLIVEKILLWYNKPTMGRKRRSREFKNNSQVIDIEKARQERLEKKQAEREKNEEKIRYAASQRTRGKMAIRRSRNRRRFVIAIIVLLIITALFFSIWGIITLKKEQSDIKKQQDALIKEKKELQKQLDEINDPKNIEQQARDQLKLIKKGEKLYIFPDELTKNKSSDSDDGEDE